MKGDFAFSENGLVAHQKGKLIASSVTPHCHIKLNQQSIKDFIGEEKLKKFINFCLHYVAYLDIPIKRGTFIEYRTGMINVSPIGRNCSQKEREDFFKYDNEHKIREKFIEVLKKEFCEYGLKFSIGGQISFDVFPEGWDKTYCLRYLKDCDEIHFFGDKTEEGGNDHEIFIDKQVIGHRVKNPEDTKAQIISLLKLDPKTFQ